MRILLLIIIFSISACSPGLDKHLDISGLVEHQSFESNTQAHTNARLDGIVDERPELAIAKWEDEFLTPDRNTSDIVSKALEQAMFDYGYNVQQHGFPAVSGEILDWFVEVEQGFPLVSAHARAKLRLNITGSGNQLLFRSIYLAETTKKSPFMSQSHIEALLSEAMHSAITEILQDPDFSATLQSSHS